MTERLSRSCWPTPQWMSTWILDVRQSRSMESMSPKRSGLPKCRLLSVPSPPTWTYAPILSRRQKKLIAEAVGGIVAEGRDITTVVAPDADVRVLLVADPAARVARRHAELAEHQIDVDDVHDQVIRRDRDDSSVAEFESAAPGVHVVDSTSLSLEEVIETICAFVPIRALGDRRDRRG